MIVHDFDLNRAFRRPDETHPELVVDADRVQPPAIPSQHFEAIAGRRPQIAEITRCVEIAQLSTVEALNVTMHPSKPTNHDIERHYFEQFRAAYELPLGTVCYGDKLDVLVKGNRTLGIEITTFIADLATKLGANKSNSCLKRRKALQHSAVALRCCCLSLCWAASNPDDGGRAVEKL